MDFDLFNSSVSGYVYLIQFKSTNHYYYGSRYANMRLGISPQDDLLKNYFTSSKIVREMLRYTPADLIVSTILFESCDPVTLVLFEQKLISEHISDPFCLNQQHRAFAEPVFKSPESYPEIACRYCDETYKINGIAWHMQACKKNQNRTFLHEVCSWCNKPVGMRAFQNHLRSCKKNPARIVITRGPASTDPCLHCRMHISKHNLKSHLKSCIQNPDYIPKYVCNFCARDMRKKHQLMIHMKTCKSNPDYSRNLYTRARTTCEYCQRSVSFNLYNRHALACLDNPTRILRNPCKYCGKEHRNGKRDKILHERKCSKSSNHDSL